MKRRFHLIAAMIGFIFMASASHASADINCQWNALNTANNVNAEDNLKNLEACSLFVRGWLLGNAAHQPTNLLELGIGKELEGDLLYVDGKGVKTKCQTVLVKNPPDFLSQQEQFVSYIKAEMDGEALDADGTIKAQSMLQKIGIDPAKVVEKIDGSLRLNCVTEMM